MVFSWTTVKELNISARIAWSPDVGDPLMYLAAGTASDNYSDTYELKPELDIYSLNLRDRPGSRLRFFASLPTVARFHKLIWGSFGMSYDKYPRGVIIGGADRGHIQLFNAGKIVNRSIDRDVRHLLTNKKKHSQEVRSLTLSLPDPSLLASGAGRCELFIWDLNVEAVVAELTDRKRLPIDELLSCLAWNKKVSHQLASTWPKGCVVWDTRTNAEIVQIDGVEKLHYNAMAWHPDSETVLSLASSSDEAPVIQLWDIRQPSAPFNTLIGHEKGIMTMDWCNKNADWLLSSGKDNRVLLWQANSRLLGGEVISEVARANDHHFDVNWCPQNPLFVATANRDHHVRLHSSMNQCCYCYCGC